MAGLGLILITAPELLNHLTTTLALLAAVLAITGLAWTRARKTHS